MKLLLTSMGIKNPSIQAALEGLLGKPIAEAKALLVMTGMYPYTGGTWQNGALPMSELGWKTFGTLELSVLSSMDKSLWMPTVREADAILVWGGDPVFLADWMRASDLAEAITRDQVYVGTSAGSMAACTFIGESYGNPPRTTAERISSEKLVFPNGLESTLVIARGMGWVDFSIIPHYAGGEQHADASIENAPVWAAQLPNPTYAIDDNTALSIVDGNVTVISEGQWKLFNSSPV